MSIRGTHEASTSSRRANAKALSAQLCRQLNCLSGSPSLSRSLLSLSTSHSLPLPRLLTLLPPFLRLLSSPATFRASTNISSLSVASTPASTPMPSLTFSPASCSLLLPSFIFSYLCFSFALAISASLPHHSFTSLDPLLCAVPLHTLLSFAPSLLPSCYPLPRAAACFDFRTFNAILRICAYELSE